MKAYTKKPARKQAAPTPKAAPKQGESAPDIPHLDQSTLAPEDIMAIQRMVGNQAVQRLIQQANPQAAAPAVSKPALSSPPFDKDMPSFGPAAPRDGAAVQRRINPLPGKSSGVFRKGRRDKINELVTTYNAAEAKSAEAKDKIAGIRALIPDIQKIWNAANTWHIDVMKKSPDKAAAIRAWMRNEVEREEDAKQAQIGELEAAAAVQAALQAAWDGASYNAEYARVEFTDYRLGAGVRWLQTPALSPIYRYFMIQQMEQTTLEAFDELAKYRLSPSRDEALRLFRKYKMDTTDMLNISGEGLGGRGGDIIREFRATMAHLASHAGDPVPATFGPVEQSVHHVINMMFTTFATTEPFQKVTTAPEAKTT